jgi:CheY-like chemotaxis protein
MSESHTGEVVALALVADLLFASRIRGAAAAAGVEVAVVQSAAAFVERARALHPRLILIDLDARSGDAPALIRDLKADPALSAVPVVAFGAHVEGPALLAARAAGAERVMARSAFVRDLPALLRGTDVARSGEGEGA